MIRIHLFARRIFFLFFSCATLMGCASVQSLTPGTGSSISVHDRTYSEVWEAGVLATQQHVTIADTNRLSGVIRASSGIGLLSRGEVVAVFIKPAASEANFHSGEIVSQNVSSMSPFGTNCVPVELEAHLPNSTSNRDQHNLWQVTTQTGTLENVLLETMNGDSLSVIVNGKKSFISIASVVQVRQTRPSKFLEGAGIGFATGGIIGGIIGYSSYSPSNDGEHLGAGLPTLGGALIGGLAGFAIGGPIGLAVSADVVYNLNGMSSTHKRAVVQSIIAAE